MSEDPIIENDKLFQPETGIVVKISPDGRATVRLSRTKACEFCGQCSVSAEDGMMELQADIPEDEIIKVNDKVRIDKKPKVQTRAILLLLVLPLIGLLLGAGLGYLAFSPKEPMIALTALLGLTLAFVISTILIRRNKWHQGAGLTITKLAVLILSLCISLSACKKQEMVPQQQQQELPGDMKHPIDVISDEDLLNMQAPFATYLFLPDSVFQRMLGKSFPEDCKLNKEDLVYMKVKHYGFDGKIHVGELVINSKIHYAVEQVFSGLLELKYPIEKIKLIDEYDANDDSSMKDNNTSAFCYRTIAGRTTLSKHALGLAIDINPLYNPCITYNKDGSIKKVEPEEGRPYIERDASDPRRITKDSAIYKLFTENGFIWGGDWNSLKDYQHFEYKQE